MMNLFFEKKGEGVGVEEYLSDDMRIFLYFKVETFLLA